jgi:hypothetical protein
LTKLFILLLCLNPIFSWCQPDYTISVNNNPYQANLFFQVGGPPSKPVNIVDSSGSLIYSEDLGLKGWAWKVNQNNQISFFDRQSKGWFLMDSLENITDSVYCQNGYIADNHDFIALSNGNYILFAYDEQPYATDTISPDGSANQNVIGLVIQELDANHNVLFEWSSWNHFYLSNYSQVNYASNDIDFLHCNAIELDEDGHILISNRTISEITKIHRTSGDIIWRFGGDQSDFTFTNDYPFSKQHCIKSLGNNRYLLYDNGNSSDLYTGGIKRSRAVEYELNLNDLTATKIWDFVHPDSLFTPSIGSVQRLENGNTLINFGNNQIINRGSIITEVNPDNEIVFEMELENGQNVYCANKTNWNFSNGPVVQIDNSIPKDKLFSIYPNPSNENFSINLKDVNERIQKVELFNIEGDLVLVREIDNTENQEALFFKHELSSGNYLVKISSKYRSAFRKLIVIK